MFVGCAQQILFEETLGQSTKDGQRFAELLANKGIVPGIKVSKGLRVQQISTSYTLSSMMHRCCYIQIGTYHDISSMGSKNGLGVRIKGTMTHARTHSTVEEKVVYGSIQRSR